MMEEIFQDKMIDQEELAFLVGRRKIRKHLSSRTRIFIRHETSYLNEDTEPEYLYGPEY